MSKMIRIESCGGCHIRLRGTCKIYNRHEWDVGPEKRQTMNIILSNCPLEDYQNNSDLEKATSIIKRLTSVNSFEKWAYEKDYNETVLKDAQEFLSNHGDKQR